MDIDQSTASDDMDDGPIELIDVIPDTSIEIQEVTSSELELSNENDTSDSYMDVENEVHPLPEIIPTTTEIKQEKDEAEVSKAIKAKILNEYLKNSAMAVVTSPDQSNINSNKIRYVKIIPKQPIQSSNESSVDAVQSTHSQTAAPIGIMDNANETILPKIESMLTTKFVPKMVTNESMGHTVNLLNNNRILIKSVKNNSVNSTQTTSKSTSTNKTINETHLLGKSSFEDVKSTIVKHNEDQTHVSTTSTHLITNQKPQATATVTITTTHNDVAFDSHTKPRDECSKSENEKNLHHAKQILNSAVVADIDEEQKVSQKIKREFVQLQKTVNQSKILSEIIIASRKRGRRPTKSGKPKRNEQNHTEADVNGEKMSSMDSFNESMNAGTPQNALRNDRLSSFSESFNSSGGWSDKRNTRSQNVDFSAKQKQFLKGIHQVTQGSDDETSDIEDDDDDLDFFVDQNAKQGASYERRKSTFVSKQQLMDTETRVSRYFVKFLRFILIFK